MIRVGLIGCGRMGERLAEQCLRVDGACVAAVCDTQPAVAHRLADKLAADADIAAVSSVEDLLRAPVDAVMIATPSYLHEPLAIACAREGRHVFCEKPMALTLEGCDRMIAAAASTGAKLMVGHVLRLIGCFRKAREMVQSGMLGRPLAVQITRMDFSAEWAKDWRGRRELCGGLMVHLCTHELDYMHALLGQPESVFATMGRTSALDVDYQDTAITEIRFAGGGVGSLTSCCASAMDRHGMVIQCSGGTIAAQGFGGPLVWARTGEQPQAISPEQMETGSPLREELSMWLGAIATGAEAPLSPADARTAVELAVAAEESARTGRSVRLPFGTDAA